MAAEDDRNALVRGLAGALANVAVLTALLVYFGWNRSEVQARRLGIDESLLGMSTRDYLLRSVRPVLVLLVVIALAGLLWLVLDRWMTRRLAAPGTTNGLARWALRLLPTSLVLLPLAAWLAGFRWPAAAYVAFPLAIVAGLLLVLYALHLRRGLPGKEPMPASRETLLRACAAVIAGIGLFTAAANYATVEGTELAEGFGSRVSSLPRVVIYSAEHLHIDAPGAQEESLPAAESAYRFRYVGLRLMEYAGGNYFLVSDGWTPRYGVVVMLGDSEPVRLEFVRDRRAT